MARKSLCVGINYEGTAHALNGCINDAHDWGDLFEAHNFETTRLLEKQATRKKMLAEITKLVTGLGAGDVGAITYSAHGSWIPDTDGDEVDGRDECFCPIDMGSDGKNLITDDEISVIFRTLHPKAKLFLVTDCCHSGSIYRFITPSTGSRSVRFLPPAHFIKSAKLTKRMDLEFGQPSKSPAHDAPPGLIHLSGCKDSEFSCDAFIDGKANGALTYYAIKAIRAALKMKAGRTYTQVWQQIRKTLPNFEFQQTPLLNGPLDLKSSKIF